MKNFATSYALNPQDLFIRFPFNKYLPIRITGWKKWKYLSTFGKMFKYLFYLIVKDIIENNTTFKFPQGTSAYLEMTPVHGKDFERARQNGAFNDVDFLVSNFTGYQLYMRYNTRYGHWKKQLYVSKPWKDKITQYTNEGKHYG